MRAFFVAAATMGLSLALVACGDSTTTPPNEVASSGVGSAAGGAGGTSSVGGAGGGCEQEQCDGLDNDCDGDVDEGCACVDGETQSCYSGDPSTEDVGACVGGTQTCNLDGEWGACEGEVVPAAVEACDGVDDDCDGELDEGFSTVSCGVGICQVTVDECVGGVFTPCLPGPPNPNGETCDQTDDDCDGMVDEGCMCVNGQTQSCYTGSQATQGVGACQDGSQLCVNGQFAACTGDVTPVPEQCNGVDDDCDGMTDEGNPDGGGGCSTGQLGICAPGVDQCQGGQIVCVPNAMPTTEVCNGFDDDCDGMTDENNPGGGGLCNTGQLGQCAVGTLTCQSGSLVCNPNNTPTTEQCNGLDDDCDGMTDENNPGGGGMCVTGQPGVCNAGTQVCQNGGLVCNANQMPSAEICNGLDDDCDGVTDENNPGGGAMCMTGQQGVCSAGTTQCQGGTVVCNPDQSPSAETCNGLDDDCDGMADENNPGGGNPCNSGQSGICAAGTTACQSGTLVCNANLMPTTEVCNGLDDDCDGQTDENNPGGGGMCTTGQAGVCSAGTLACQSGSLVCNPNQTPSPEQCNGLDDDCDGQTDEGNPGGGSSCMTGLLGECAAGTIQCTGGMLGCSANQGPTSEICGNGLDDDCDGMTDEGCCPVNSLSSTSPQTIMGNNGSSPAAAIGSCAGAGPEDSYSFTAPWAGQYTFDTIGSPIDTVLYARDGGCGGVELACNDDNINLESLITVTLAMGQTIALYVDSYSTGGAYTLNVSSCPSQSLGSTSPQTVNGNSASSPSNFSGSCAGSGPEDSYSFTAPSTGVYTFDTIGSAIDTVLHVRDAGCGGTELACDDDGGPGVTSLVTVSLVAGQTVVVFADSFSSGGAYTLNVSGP